MSYLNPQLCSHELLGMCEMVANPCVHHHQEKENILQTLKQKGKETPQRLLYCLTNEYHHAGHKDLAMKLAEVIKTYKIPFYCPKCEKDMAVTIT